MLDRVATRGNVTGLVVVRASRALLRMWDAVCGEPINNEQHIKHINIGTLKTQPTKTGQTACTLHGPSAVSPKQTLESRALRQCFCVNKQLTTSLFEKKRRVAHDFVFSRTFGTRLCGIHFPGHSEHNQCLRKQSAKNSHTFHQ